MWEALFIIPPLLFAVILHEVAHAWIADLLGDPTARRLGRISLNPIQHIDLFLTIILPAVLIFTQSPFIFGGAKPVPVNPLNFQNPRRDMAYVAIAGPATNFILAIICFTLLNILPQMLPDMVLPFWLLLLLTWLVQGFLINVALGVFNLLPVPPLDGGRIVVGFLPLPLAKQWAKLERFGLLIVVALLLSGAVDSVLSPVLDFAQKILFHLR